jgi:hypothetical protein
VVIIGRCSNLNLAVPVLYHSSTTSSSTAGGLGAFRVCLQFFPGGLGERNARQFGRIVRIRLDLVAGQRILEPAPGVLQVGRGARWGRCLSVQSSQISAEDDISKNAIWCVWETPTWTEGLRCRAEESPADVHSVRPA